MAGKISWKSFFVDMIGVLIGITIAFQLQNWKEKSSDRKLEKQYLSSISADLEKDSVQLQVLLDTMKVGVKNSSFLTQDIIRRNFEHDSIFNHYMSLMFITKFEPYNTTFQSMVNSGDLKLIKDFDLRNEITDLYDRHHPEVEIYDQSHVDIFYDSVYPYVSKRVQFTGRNSFRDTDFMQTTEFSNMAFTNYGQLLRQQGTYQQTLKKTNALKARIDSILQ